MAKNKVPATKAPAPVKTQADMLDDLLGGLEATVVEQPKGDEKYRPTVEAETGLMIAYTGIHAIHKVVDEKKKELGDNLKAEVWENFTNLWFSQKSRPSNPKVETKTAGGKIDCSTIYQVRASFKVNAIEGSTSARAAVIQALVMAGIAEEMANKVFDENIEIVIETGFKPFNEIAKGKWVAGEGGKDFIPATDIQKAAAVKLLAWAKGESTEFLTPQERMEVLAKDTTYIVKAGFLDRVAHYCHSADELRAILTVIEPGEALSAVKFAASDTPKERHERMEQHFHDVLYGIAAGDDE